MTGPGVLRVASRIGLLLTLLALSVFLGVRTTLGSQDTVQKRQPVTKVVKKGPVTVDTVVWRLDKLQLFTRLVKLNKEPIDLDVPDGAVVAKATLTLTATDRTKLDDGFTCNAVLRDDRGNTWEDEDVVSGLDLPTYCGDSDLDIVRGKPFQVALVYLIPKESAKHLVGLMTPGTDNSSVDERVLITP